MHATDASPRREAPALREIGRRYPMDELQAAVTAGMVVGHPDMPEILLEPGEHEVFFAYLRSLQPAE